MTECTAKEILGKDVPSVQDLKDQYDLKIKNQVSSNARQILSEVENLRSCNLPEASQYAQNAARFWQESKHPHHAKGVNAKLEEIQKDLAKINKADSSSNKE